MSLSTQRYTGQYSWKDPAETVSLKHWRDEERSVSLQRKKKTIKEKKTNQTNQKDTERKSLNVSYYMVSFLEGRNRNTVWKEEQEATRFLLPETIMCYWIVESIVLISDLMKKENNLFFFFVHKQVSDYSEKSSFKLGIQEILPMYSEYKNWPEGPKPWYKCFKSL